MSADIGNNISINLYWCIYIYISWLTFRVGIFLRQNIARIRTGNMSIQTSPPVSKLGILFNLNIVSTMKFQRLLDMRIRMFFYFSGMRLISSKRSSFERLPWLKPESENLKHFTVQRSQYKYNLSNCILYYYQIGFNNVLSFFSGKQLTCNRRLH